MNLEKPTLNHTLHHMAGVVKAYICGGTTINNIVLKDIVEFDISNQKFKTFGILNTARFQAGVVTCHKYLWVFGGQFDYGDYVDSIERVSLDTGGIFS